MHKKNLKILVSVLAIAAVLGGGVTVYAESYTKTDALEQRQDALKDLTTANQDIVRLTEQRDELMDKIAVIEPELTNVLSEIEAAGETLTEEQEALEAAKCDLILAMSDETAYKQTMQSGGEQFTGALCRDCFETITFLDGTMESRSTTRCYDAVYDVESAVLAEYTAVREDAEEANARLSDDVDELTTRLDELFVRRDELESDLAEKTDELTAVNAALDEANAFAGKCQFEIDNLGNILTSDDADYATMIDVDDPVAAGEELVEYAEQFIGNPYVWGGESLTNGCDCSGFVQQLYKHYGVDLPHYSGSQRHVGYAVSVDEIQKGDIVCYDGHVGIYAGNGRIINAFNSNPYPRGGIRYNSMYIKKILCIRRIFV